jgi:hypothetical protein
LPAFDLRGAVAARGAHEILDAPAGLGFDVVADGHRGQHDAQVGFYRFAEQRAPSPVRDGTGSG